MDQDCSRRGASSGSNATTPTWESTVSSVTCRPARDDRENRVVARNDYAYVLLNNYPYNPGHAMVIPFDHTGNYRDLDEATLLGHARLKQRTFDALEDALGPDAFNAGSTSVAAPRAGPSTTTSTPTSSRAGRATPTSCPS